MHPRVSLKPLMLVVAVLVLSAGAWAWSSRDRAVPSDAAQTPPAKAPAAAATPAPPPLEPLPPEEVKRFTDAWVQQPRIPLGIPNDGAKIVIVKFNDWLCPACKGYGEAYQPVLDKYQKEMPGAIKYVIRDWPWNSHCNFTVPQTFGGHESSCEAAVAVRMAREKGKDKEMIAWLFSEQQRLIDLRTKMDGAAAEVRAKATSLLGLKPNEFAQQFALLQTPIRQDVADGVALQVEVTPTYYINGVKTTTPVNRADGTGGQNLPPNLFNLALQLELKKAPGK